MPSLRTSMHCCCAHLVSMACWGVIVACLALPSAVTGRQLLQGADNGTANALLTIRQQLGNPQTLALWGAASSDPCNGWAAVICNAAHQVVELDLGIDTGLSGNLPDTFTQLTSLQTLYLNSNNLRGTLPPSWSAITSLALLSLWGNNIQGPLPTQWSTLTKLKTLALGFNQLTGSIPSSWTSLTNMELLDLSSNSLMCNTIPAQLSNVTYKVGTNLGLACASAPSPAVPALPALPPGIVLPPPPLPFLPGFVSDAPPSPPPAPPPSPPPRSDSNWIKDNTALFIIIIILGVLAIICIILLVLALLFRKKANDAANDAAAAKAAAAAATAAAAESAAANHALREYVAAQVAAGALKGDPPPPSGGAANGTQAAADGQVPANGDEGTQNWAGAPATVMAEGDYVANTHAQYYGTQRIVDKAGINAP